MNFDNKSILDQYLISQNLDLSPINFFFFNTHEVKNGEFQLKRDR